MSLRAPRLGAFLLVKGRYKFWIAHKKTLKNNLGHNIIKPTPPDAVAG
jgi:hypothetical protein